MVSRNTGSIAQMVRDSIDSIPTTVDSGTNIKDWIDLGALRVENYTGTAISTSDVPTKFQPVLFDLGRAFTLAKMIGVGVDFNVSLGEFSVSKAAGGSTESMQLTSALEMANQEMKMIGRNIPISTVRA